MIELATEEGGIQNQNGNTTAFTDGTDAVMVVPYTMDELEALYSNTRNIETQTSSIIRATTGAISIIASSTLIWMISRSENGFRSTQNRLLLGICISDIILSFNGCSFNVAAPTSDAYITWNANGTTETCAMLGFSSYLGLSCTMFFHTSLSIFYLLVVRFEKSKEYICTKIEPFFHGIPITFGLIFSIFALVNGNLNNTGNGLCVSPINNLPHCIGYEAGEVRDGFEIPCYRGADTFIIIAIFYSIVMFIPSIVIATSTIMIYRYVSTLENRMSQFGAASFRARIT